MRAVPDLAYRDFQYPLNVFMHVLTHEEGGVEYLHYGLFESATEGIAAAQERSTALLLERLPAPPARLLDVGIGVGTTLARLTGSGYAAEGITPDLQQVALVRARHGDAVRVECIPFESFAPGRRFDCIVFQESAQYIESDALFARSRELAPRVIVIDEFTLREGGTLHRLDTFLAAAEANGFRKTEEVDLSAKAAPTVEYFMQRIPRYRGALVADLGLTDSRIDELLASGTSYLEQYRNGTYGYRLLQFARRA